MTGQRVRIARTRAFVSALVTVLALLGLGSTAGEAAAAPPAAPVLLSPANGTDVTIPFTISWSAVSGAGGYRWELSRSSAFGTVLERSPAPGPRHAVSW